MPLVVTFDRTWSTFQPSVSWSCKFTRQNSISSSESRLRARLIGSCAERRLADMRPKNNRLGWITLSCFCLLRFRGASQPNGMRLRSHLDMACFKALYLRKSTNVQSTQDGACAEVCRYDLSDNTECTIHSEVFTSGLLNLTRRSQAFKFWLSWLSVWHNCLNSWYQAHAPGRHHGGYTLSPIFYITITLIGCR